MLRVAYFTHEYDVVNGSTRSLLNMLNALREDVKPLIIFPKEGSTVELFRSKGYQCEVIPFVTYHLKKDRKLWLRRLKNAFVDQISKRNSIKKLKTILLKNHVQIIHTNSSVISIGYETAKKMHVPHVWHIREFIDADFNCYPIYGFKNLIKSIHNSDATISISRAVQSHFMLKDKPNAYQIYNAVISGKEEVSKDQKDKYFMLAGHLMPQKGVGVAIEAFHKFTKKYGGNEYKLVLIGEIDSLYKQELISLIHTLQIDGRIQFVDYSNQLKDYYTKASAYLMCSRMEGLGRVSIEAMNYGCPVIGFNSGGTAEIIQNGENGFLYNSIDECAELMYKVLNPTIRNSIIQNAKKFVKENFTEEVYRSKVLELYKTLIK